MKVKEGRRVLPRQGHWGPWGRHVADGLDHTYSGTTGLWPLAGQPGAGAEGILSSLQEGLVALGSPRPSRSLRGGEGCSHTLGSPCTHSPAQAQRLTPRACLAHSLGAHGHACPRTQDSPFPGAQERHLRGLSLSPGCGLTLPKPLVPALSCPAPWPGSLAPAPAPPAGLWPLRPRRRGGLT